MEEDQGKAKRVWAFPAGTQQWQAWLTDGLKARGLQWRTGLSWEAWGGVTTAIRPLGASGVQEVWGETLKSLHGVGQDNELAPGHFGPKGFGDSVPCLAIASKVWNDPTVLTVQEGAAWIAFKFESNFTINQLNHSFYLSGFHLWI